MKNTRTMITTLALGVLTLGAVGLGQAADTTATATSTDPAPVDIRIPTEGNVVAVVKEHTGSDGITKCFVAAGYGGIALACNFPPAPPEPTAATTTPTAVPVTPTPTTATSK